MNAPHPADAAVPHCPRPARSPRVGSAMRANTLRRLLPCVLAGASLASAAGAQLAFVPNRGQWDAPAAFRAELGEQTAWFAADGFVLAREPRAAASGGAPCAAGRGVAVRLSFVEATACAEPASRGLDLARASPGSRGSHATVLRGEGRRIERRHWFTQGRAITDVPAYDTLHYGSAWPGVDVALHGGDGGLEYDLCLRPGADVSAIALRCEGTLGLELDDDGALLLHTELGTLRQAAPRTWVVLADGGRQTVQCRYRLIGTDRFGFELPDAPAGLPVVIDPVLAWASYLGGTSLEYVYAVASSGAGLTVAGATSVANFPASLGAYDSSWNGQQDAFVSRFAPDGKTLLYSTYLGGSKDEEARAVALDGTGAVVVAGWTASANFPTSPGAFDKGWSGGTGTLRSDAFVTRLSPSGSALAFSTYLGGSKEDFASSLGIDGAGRVHVAGKTSSADFPTTTTAFDHSYNGGSTDVGDAFVACLAADGGSLVSSTFLGGAGDEFANALLVAEDGGATVAGWTASAGFPVTACALDGQLSGTSDAFVARLSADGSSLAFATFLGGSEDDNATALATGADGAPCVAGTTLSSDFPVTAGAGQAHFGGGTYFGDAFVAILGGDGAVLRSASYLGGSGDDVANGLGLAPDGTLAVGGWTQSADFPLGDQPLDSTLGGASDAFLARVDPTDATLLAASYFGGPSLDKAYALAVSADGSACLAGYTNSGAFPVTAGSYDTHFDGFEGLIGDGFVAQFALELGSGTQAAAWVDAGYALAGSAGVLPALAATGNLAPLSEGVVSLEHAAPSALVLLFSGTVAGYVPVKGGTLVPFPIFSTIVTDTDALGGLVIPYTWPAGVESGLTLLVQAWTVDAGAVFGLSASNAIAATAP